MKRKKLVYLYEAARYQDPSVVKYYVEKFLSEHQEANKGSSTWSYQDSFSNVVQSWSRCNAENQIIHNDYYLSSPEVNPTQNLLAILEQDYNTIRQDLAEKLDYLHQDWSKESSKWIGSVVDLFPNPLDSILDEKTKSRIAILADASLNEELARLDYKMRNNMKEQLAARLPIAKALERFPQLLYEFEDEVNNQKRLGNTIEAARQIAINKVIDPIQQLNVSIILAGNVFNYVEDAKKIFKEYLGKEILP